MTAQLLREPTSDHPTPNMTTLKVATLNASSVQSPLEMKVGGVDVPGADRMFYEYRKQLDTCKTSVMHYIGSDTVDEIIRMVTAHAADIDVNMIAGVDKWIDDLGKTPLAFVSDSWIEKSRVVSACDRVANERESIIAKGYTSGKSSTRQHTFDVVERLLSPKIFDARLKPLEHAKYPEFPVELEPASKYMQVMYTATFDAIVHATMARLPADIDCRRIGQKYAELMRTKEDMLVNLMHASDVDVWLCQEVEPGFITNVESCRMYKAYFTTQSKQMSTIFYRTDKIVFIDGVVPIVGMTVNERLAGCDVVVKATGQRVTLWCVHCKSDGSDTISTFEAIAEHGASRSVRTPVVVGGDTNAQRALRVSLDDLLTHYGFDITIPLDTIRRIREIIGVQWSKISHDGTPTEEPKDLVAISGGLIRDELVDNTGQGHYTEGLIAPNTTLPTDHFIVRATVSF